MAFTHSGCSFCATKAQNLKRDDLDSDDLITLCFEVVWRISIAANSGPRANHTNGGP